VVEWFILQDMKSYKHMNWTGVAVFIMGVPLACTSEGSGDPADAGADSWQNVPGDAGPDSSEDAAETAADAGADSDADTDSSSPDAAATPCDPAGTWEVVYDCPNANIPSESLPGPDTIIVEPAQDGGWAGSMTTHLEEGVKDPQAQSGVSIDAKECRLSAYSHSSWTLGAEMWCDWRGVSLLVADGTATGSLAFVLCQGYPPASSPAKADCIAVAHRK